MTNEKTLIDALLLPHAENGKNIACSLRAAVRACLPDRAFLRRDNSGLFVTNAPLFGESDLSRLTALGLSVRRQGSLLFFSCDTPLALALDDAVDSLVTAPPSFLSRSLARFRGALPACPAPLDSVLRTLDAGKPVPETDRCVRAAAATCLRTKKGGAGLYAASRLLDDALPF